MDSENPLVAKSKRIGETLEIKGFLHFQYPERLKITKPINIAIRQYLSTFLWTPKTPDNSAFLWTYKTPGTLKGFKADTEQKTNIYQHFAG